MEGRMMPGLSLDEILAILPHRYPFLLVDRIIELEERRVVGIKNVTINEPFFPGHIPGFPVMPGVLVVEAMAQVGACLILNAPQLRGRLAYLAGIDHCRFRRPLVPGGTRGRRLVCVQIGRENPALEALADVFASLSLEKWEQLLDLWQRHGVREVLVAGSIPRSDLLAQLSGGDAVVRGFLERLPDRRDQSVLDAVAGVLQFLGIRILDQMAYIRAPRPQPGLLAGGPPSGGEQGDVEMGLSVARTLADLDVGQTVVLKQGVILAAEAAEGTDATIRRGGAMASA